MVNPSRTHTMTTKQPAREIQNKKGWTLLLLVASICFAPSCAQTFCTPSTLPGYDCTYELEPARYVLHWTFSNGGISFAAQAATSGWVGIGFSLTGAMTGSHAVVYGSVDAFSPPSMAVYSLAYYGLTPSTSFAISNASVEQMNYWTTVKFWRSLEMKMEDGFVPLVKDQAVNIIWACKADIVIQYHDMRGSASVPLLGPESAAAAPPPLPFPFPDRVPAATPVPEEEIEEEEARQKYALCLGLGQSKIECVVSLAKNRSSTDGCIYARRTCGSVVAGQGRQWNTSGECIDCFTDALAVRGGCGASMATFLFWAQSVCLKQCVPSSVCDSPWRKCGMQDGGCGQLIRCNCKRGFQCRNEQCVEVTVPAPAPTLGPDMLGA